MRTARSLLLAGACVFVFSYQGTAQDSTSNSTLHLGRVSMQKEFTQSITIKGTDLERMPFASLSEALQALSFGYLANNTNMVFVIDGVVINDVNVYSKYDIEEVVLVQNAVSTLNGAFGAQILALVKTRKSGPKPSGFVVAGQSFLVKTDSKQTKGIPVAETGKDFFHNYHASGYLNTKSVQFNVSANYLRNVYPAFLITTPRTAKPAATDRLGINGWLQAQLGRAHALTFRINATPQIGRFKDPVKRTGSINGYYDQYREKTTIINPSLVLQSKLAKGLTNELTASFATGKGVIDASQEITYTQGGAGMHKLNNTTKVQQWVVMDNIAYHAPVGNGWSLDPSLNLFYRHVKYDMESVSSTQAPGGGLGGGGISYSWESRSQKGGIFLLTPSLNLYYRKAFNFQAGVQTNLSKTNGNEINKVLPFATTSIDVVHLFKPLSTTSLRLFGSIGQSDNVGDLAANLGTTTYIPYIGFISIMPVINPFQPKKTLWNWQTGTRLGILKDRLTVSYAFENRSYMASFVIQLPSTPMPSVVLAERLVKSHNINVQWQVVNEERLNWRTGINAIGSKDEIRDLPISTPVTPLPGISLGWKRLWTGGWTNRLAINRLTAGVDVLYNFNPQGNTSTLPHTRIDAVSMANVYLGYVFPLAGNRTVEFYASVRNPVQDKDLKSPESFKYYGVGFKANL